MSTSIITYTYKITKKLQKMLEFIFIKTILFIIVIRKDYTPIPVRLIRYWWLARESQLTWEAENKRIVVQGQSRQIVRENTPKPHLQNNQSKMDWRCGLVVDSYFASAIPQKKKKFLSCHSIFTKITLLYLIKLLVYPKQLAINSCWLFSFQKPNTAITEDTLKGLLEQLSHRNVRFLHIKETISMLK
jgi:hypothetical protein